LCLAKGDRIAVHSPNRLEVLEIYAACAQLGVICVPIWSELSVSDITLILRDTEPRLVITSPQLCRKVDLARRELPYDVTTMALGSRQPLGKMSFEALIKDAAQAYQGDWTKVIARRTEVGMGSAWMILYGAGGSMRGAVRTQAATVQGFVQQVQLMGLTHLTNALVTHSMSTITGFFYSALWCYVGASQLMYDLETGNSGIELLQRVAEHNLNFLVMAPGYFSQMLSVPAEVWSSHARSWGSVHTMLLAGAATQSGLASWALEALPHVRLYCTYETREAGLITILSQGFGRIRNDNKGMMCVGREPIGNSPVKIMDAEENELERGTIGEIWAQTPMIFAGYWNDGSISLEDTATGIGYVRTGDLGMRDQSGHILVYGRVDSAVKLPWGMSVFPQDIAARVQDWHDDVAEAAVVTLDRGELVAVLGMTKTARWATPSSDITGSDEQGEAADKERAQTALTEISLRCIRELAWYQLPKQVVMLNLWDFPLDAAGTPDDAKLVGLIEAGTLQTFALASM